ncbi:MAG: hypothetical protein M0Z41_02615 [Peptococcaceae bacterium]|jgi:hypothetical protein|nr:hypothetical protein [Peptococcaceae bacterium]
MSQGLVKGLDHDRIPAISCKRRDVLRLSLKEYKDHADLVTAGFEMDAKFLHGQTVFSGRDLPCRTQLVPLAAIFAALGEEGEKGGVRDRIARWYWCGVFGELYGSGIETRFAKDFPQVVDWVSGGPEPDSIRDANFVPGRLLSVRTRNSAVYNGLISLLMRDGCRNLRTGEAIDVQVYFYED